MLFGIIFGSSNLAHVSANRICFEIKMLFKLFCKGWHVSLKRAPMNLQTKIVSRLEAQLKWIQTLRAVPPSLTSQAFTRFRCAHDRDTKAGIGVGCVRRWLRVCASQSARHGRYSKSAVLPVGKAGADAKLISQPNLPDATR